MEKTLTEPNEPNELEELNITRFISTSKHSGIHALYRTEDGRTFKTEKEAKAHIEGEVLAKRYYKKPLFGTRKHDLVEWDSFLTWLETGCNKGFLQEVLKYLKNR